MGTIKTSIESVLDTPSAFVLIYNYCNILRGTLSTAQYKGNGNHHYIEWSIFCIEWSIFCIEWLGLGTANLHYSTRIKKR